MKKVLYKNSPLLAFIWAAIIFVLCATPGQYIPRAHWLDLLSVDKLVHATMFFILSSFLFLVAIKFKQDKKWLIIYFLICVSYGGLLEIMQAKFFSNRSADWLDFIANTFGCLMAGLFFKKLKKIFTTTEQKLSD